MAWRLLSFPPPRPTFIAASLEPDVGLGAKNGSERQLDIRRGGQDYVGRLQTWISIIYFCLFESETAK